MVLKISDKKKLFGYPNSKEIIHPEFEGLEGYISSLLDQYITSIPIKPVVAFLKMKDLSSEETFTKLVNLCRGVSVEENCITKCVHPIIVIGIEDLKESVKDDILKKFSVNKRFYQNENLKEQKKWLWSDCIWHQYVGLDENFEDSFKAALNKINDWNQTGFYDIDRYHVFASERLTLWETQNWKLTPDALGALKLSNGKTLEEILIPKDHNSSKQDDYSNPLAKLTCLLGRILTLLVKELEKDSAGITGNGVIEALSKKVSDKRLSLYKASHDGLRSSIDSDKYLFNAGREAILAAKCNFDWSVTFRSVLVIDDDVDSATEGKTKDIAKFLNQIFAFDGNTARLYGAGNFADIKGFENSEPVWTFEDERKSWEKCGNGEKFKSLLRKVGYLLVDLWDGRAMSGFETIKTLRGYFADIAATDDTGYVPVIVAMSQLDDPDTVRLAYESGADGFLSKREPSLGSVCFSLVRSGVPFKNKDYLHYMRSLADNFGCIQRLPRLVRQQLHWQKVSPMEVKDATEINECRYDSTDLRWLRLLPKTDLHVHFGMAIHPYWCYTLAVISVYKYCKQNQKLKDKLPGIFKFFKKVFDAEDVKNCNDANKFRGIVVSRMAQQLNDAYVNSVNGALSVITHIHNTREAKDFVACALSTYLCLIRHGEELEKWLIIAERTLVTFKDKMFAKNVFNEGESKNDGESYVPLNPRIYAEGKVVVDTAKIDDYKKILKFIKEKGPFSGRSSCKWSFDPLSSLMAVRTPSGSPKETRGYGLSQYIGAADLSGGSLLHFPETVILASIAIPRWCNPHGLQDLTESNMLTGSLEEAYFDARKGAYRDNIVHLELRTTPSGFLSPYEEKDPRRAAMAIRLILCGLEFGCRYPSNDSTPRTGVPKITANLLLSVKRDRDLREVESLIALAVDFTKEFSPFAEEKETAREAEFTPHVSGLDVAGIERGNLPEKLREHYKEAFENCLISAIHAGETEDPVSIWQAIHYLGAKRLGHALTLAKDKNLYQFVRDTGLPVEMCPRSNQFVYGFSICPDDKNRRYVFYDYCKSGIRVNINTDDPVLSHRLSPNKHFVYPLAEEFQWLAAGASTPNEAGADDEPGNYLTRLKVLQLTYNGFAAMFCSPQLKAARIARADREIYRKLVEAYIDCGCQDRTSRED